MIDELSHLLRTKIRGAGEASQGLLIDFLFDCVGDAEISEHEPLQGIAEEDIVWLDVFVHNIEAVKQLQAL